MSGLREIPTEFLLINILCLISHINGDLDIFYPLRSLSVPENQRRTFRLLVWEGDYAPGVSEPAVLWGMSRIENNTIFPEYVAVSLRMQSACSASPGSTERFFIGFEQLVAARDHFREEFGTPTIHALIGPYSTGCLGNLGHLLTHYNIPVFPNSAMGAVFNEGDNRQTIYPTLSRVMHSSDGIAEGLLKLVKEMHWNQVALIAGQKGNFGRSIYASLAVKSTFRRANVSINYYARVGNHTSPVATHVSNDTEYVKILEDIQKTARIVILIAPKACDNTELKFLQIAKTIGMYNGKYVFITAQVTGAEPTGTSKNWCPDVSDSELYQQPFVMKMTYQGFSLKDMAATQKKFLTFGRAEDTKNELVMDMMFADGMYLMANSVSEVLRDYGWDNVTNGQLVQEYSSRRKLEGMDSTLVMNEIGDRIAEFYVQKLDENGDVRTMVSFDLTVECYNCSNGKMSYFLNFNYNNTDPLFPNNMIPLDEPACGFDNGKCDYTMELMIVFVILITILVALLVYKMRQFIIRRRQLAMVWRIDLDTLNVVLKSPKLAHNPEEKLYSRKSLGSMYSIPKSDVMPMADHVITSGDNDMTLQVEGQLNGVRVMAYQSKQNNRIDYFSMASLKTLETLRHISVDTLNSFMGISFNQHQKFTVVWKYEARCTLHNVIGNSDFNLSEVFQISFLSDIVKGLDYMHRNVHICHGSLNAKTCLLTPQWTVRISNFGLNEVMGDLVRRKLIVVQMATVHELLHVAPELVNIVTNKSNMAEFMAYSSEIQPSADIYSLGVVAHEVLYRCVIEENVNEGYVMEELTAIAHRAPIKWLSNPSSKAVNDLESVMRCCTDVKVNMRPSIESITKYFIKSNFSSGTGIVDHMIKMMQNYANDLEHLVDERTESLVETQKRADTLLHQLLPKTVAEDLKAGRTVMPELFESATIGFTDFVGFTQICAHSTPMQIVNLLNEVFSQFDAIVSSFDVYKVETIGDAYMIVSGLPKRNGTRHAHDICVTLMGMMAVSLKTRIKHMDSDFRMGMRGGVHTGPVAAGVVGMHAPRYCLFGDTVNTASRMESYSLTNRVQISDETNQMLIKSTKGLRLRRSKRGRITVKGKGDMVTHWLVGGLKIDML